MQVLIEHQIQDPAQSLSKTHYACVKKPLNYAPYLEIVSFWDCLCSKFELYGSKPKQIPEAVEVL